MKEQIFDIVKGTFPNNKWEIESKNTPNGMVHKFVCDGENTKIGFSEGLATRLASLNKGDPVQQTLNILIMQFKDYFKKKGVSNEKKENKLQPQQPVSGEATTRKEIY